MKMKHLKRLHQQLKPVPLWKWLVIILLIVALPLFFSLVRSTQIQQALQTSQPK